MVAGSRNQMRCFAGADSGLEWQPHKKKVVKKKIRVLIVVIVIVVFIVVVVVIVFQLSPITDY